MPIAPLRLLSWQPPRQRWAHECSPPAHRLLLPTLPLRRSPCAVPPAPFPLRGGPSLAFSRRRVEPFAAPFL